MSRRPVLDVANGAPLYRQLRRELFSRIRRGEFGAGAGLPSENQLCEEYGVNSTTARRALLELVKEGVIRRRGGVGTMVGSRVRQAHIAVLSVDYVGDAWGETSAAMGELIADVGELTWKRDASISMSGCGRGALRRLSALACGGQVGRRGAAAHGQRRPPAAGGPPGGCPPAVRRHQA